MAEKHMVNKTFVVSLAALCVSLITLLIVASLVKQLKLSGDFDLTPDKNDAPAGTATAPVLPLTYDAAVDLYGDYRFQFIGCHGTPGEINVAKGATVMLDNRDAKKHTIMIGTKSYALGAYGFAIANSGKTAGDFNITCDGGGAATLHVR